MPARPRVRVGVGTRARVRRPVAPPPGRFYFDWGKTAKSQRKGASPFTPAVSLFLGLDVALGLIERKARGRARTPSDPRSRHPRRHRRVGLELFGDPDERSTVVTAVELPDDIDGNKVPARCASSASRPTAARTTSRAASCGSPTAATSAPSTSSPRSPAWRWCWTSSAATSSTAPPPAPPRRCSSRPASPPRREPRSTAPYRVLVAETIADSGVAMLRERFDVDLGVDWSDDELADRIGGYDGILIRSATKLTADLIARGEKLKVIGRAGVGVDNVDVEAATKRGIIVANAPQSNVITAAEHTVALMLALARNVPQAHAALDGRPLGALEVGRVEVYEKTLGLLGFGRIGQLVAARAQGFGMHVVAFDPFVSAARFRELGVEKASPPTSCTRGGLHLDPPAEDARDRALARRRGARQVPRRRAHHQLRARRAGRRRRAQGRARLREGRGRRARRLHARAGHRPPAVRLPQRRRHTAPRGLDDRGAGSRRRADRRAGRRRARPAASCRPPSTSRRSRAEDMDVLGPVPAARARARPRRDRARRGLEHRSRSRSSTSAASPSATRGCSRSASSTACSPATRTRTSTSSTRRRWPRSAGSRYQSAGRPSARDFTDLVRITFVSGDDRTRVVGTTLGRRTARTCSRPGASASTCSSTRTTSRCSATTTCRAWSAASAPRSASTA